MNTTIYFTIKTQTENKNTQQIDFKLEFNEDGENTDGYSFNPTSGWTNYNNFDQGWTEQDEQLQEALLAIKDYSQSMQLESIVADATKEDIGKTTTTKHYCDGYVTENKDYTFEVTITDIRRLW